jgi:hypothetical protein
MKVKSVRDTTPVNKSLDFIPGPGAYTVIDNLTKTSSSKAIKWNKQISREQLEKKEKNKNSIIGPGKYETKPQFGEGPKVFLFVYLY